MNRKVVTHWLNRALLTAVGGLLAAAPQALAEGGNVPDQGRRLHGTARERLERTNLILSTARQNNLPLQGVSLSQGQLTAPGQSGSALVNVTFTRTIAGEPVTFRILAARPHVNRYAAAPASPSATAWEYKVEYTSASLGTAPLCPGEEADRWALALPGSWGGSTYSTFSTSTIAFGCLPRVAAPTRGGVAAKCVEMGYAPWQSSDPRIDGSTLPLSAADSLRYHVTCTSLASADYCGEGTSNTLSGTPIKLYHPGNIQTQVDDSGKVRIAPGPVHTDYYFEAAWALVDASTGQPVTSAALPSRVRAQALCLTKKRWATLPLHGTCIADNDEDPLNNRLPDPRNPDSPWGTQYCEDYTHAELIQKGAVLFSYSKFLDAALYRFQNQVTGEYLTTSQIYILPMATDNLKAIYFPDPAVFANAGQYLLANDGLDDSYEGPLFRPETPPHLFEGAAVSPLRRYRAQAGSPPYAVDTFLTVSDTSGVAVPGNYGQEAIEGYVYAGAAIPDQAPALKLYRSLSTGTFLTTSRTEFVTVSHVSQTSTPMGYLPRLEHYAAPVPW
jgi:hypothetical protein